MLRSLTHWGAPQCELLKINKCGSILPPSGKLVPFIVDTHGALGQSLPSLSRSPFLRSGSASLMSWALASRTATGAVIRGVAGIAALAKRATKAK